MKVYFPAPKRFLLVCICLLRSETAVSSEPAPAPCTPGPDQVSFYQHANYQGKCVVLGVGRYENAAKMGIANDSISSARVGTGVRAVSYEHSGFRGMAYRHETSEQSFRLIARPNPVPGASSKYKPGDKASSVIVMRIKDPVPDFVLEGDTSCAWGSKDCNRCVNDVEANFDAIETHFRGERASKIRVKSYAYPTKDYLLHRINAFGYEHIQGVGRIAGLGNEEYFVFTHSTASDQAGKSGALAVIRMGANQNSKGFELGDLSESAGSDQKIHNRTVARTYADSNHPGGLATLGHYVFVADWCQPHGNAGWCSDPSQTAFEVYDVSNVHKNEARLNSNPPIRIIDRSVFVEGDAKRGKSTASVAATRLKNGKYLVGIGRSGGSNYEYYLSDTTSLSSKTKWLSTGYPQNITKHGEGAAMVNECSTGDVYLIQIENSGTRYDTQANDDQLHLFRLLRDSSSGPIEHQYIDSQTFRCSDGSRWCDLDKGGGIYISPTGNMYLYATTAQQTPLIKGGPFNGGDSKDSERFRMVEFGNNKETGYAPGQGTNKTCEDDSIATCGKHSAQCMVVHTLSGLATDVCHWPAKNNAAACKGAAQYWTIPGSKYAKNHPDVIPPGSSGICASEVKNLRNLKPALDVAALAEAIGGMQVGQWHVAEVPTPGKDGLAAPSGLTLSEISSQSLRLNWLDNATVEYGVWVERGNPVEDRGGINYQWQPVFKVEERVSDRIKGTGWRSDSDDGLRAGTEYCYRLRAYTDKAQSEYSKPACATTLPADSSGSSENTSEKPGGVPAPTELTFADVGGTSLTLRWMDNATIEYGVTVQRGMPINTGSGIDYRWETVFHVEERVDSRVKGTGLRTDGDDGLSPNTAYCYRLRAFYMSEVSAYTEPACVRTAN